MAAVRTLLVATLLLAAPTVSIPALANDPLTPVVSAVQGRPEGPWPRASPPADLPPVRGHGYMPTMLISNVGSEPFVGDRIIEIPELHVSRRVPMQLGLTAGISDSDLTFDPDVLVPSDAPDRITVRLWFEAQGERVGQGFDVSLQVYDEAGFCATPTLAYAAGAKDVHAPWDFPYYAFDLCNWSPETRCVTLTAIDRNTGRPLLQPFQTMLTVDALRTLLGVGYAAGGSSDLACMRPHSSIAFLTTFEAAPLVPTPADVLPRFALLWDDGRFETVDGDAQTFAGVNPPRAPPPLGT